MFPCCVQGPRSRLSRELVALWADDYKPALDLLERIFPLGLMNYLRQRPPKSAGSLTPNNTQTMRLPRSSLVTLFIFSHRHPTYLVDTYFFSIYLPYHWYCRCLLVNLLSTVSDMFSRSQVDLSLVKLSKLDSIHGLTELNPLTIQSKLVQLAIFAVSHYDYDALWARNII